MSREIDSNMLNGNKRIVRFRDDKFQMMCFKSLIKLEINLTELVVIIFQLYIEEYYN